MQGTLLLRLLLILSLIALLSATGCALYPSSTAPVQGGGKATGQGISNTARNHIGVKYKSGGVKPSTGFDCSGLVCWTYAQHGISVPRTTKDQMKMGSAVSKDRLKPGDVVVFRISSRSGLHTGIYSGNGKFIHSPSSGKTVREDSINSDYWKPRYLTARRLPQVIR